MARKSGSQAGITGPKVRAAALRLFAAQGYAAVSMRQIAAEVGVQAGALYLYTPDKQSLLVELMRGHLEDLVAAWQAEPKGAGGAEALEAFVRFHLRFHAARPEAAVLARMERRNLDPEHRAAVAALWARYEGALEAILAAGDGAGEFSVPDPGLAAAALLAMLDGIVDWRRHGGGLAPERVERICWNMARRAVGA